jgi:hypothetical protein
MNTKVRSPPSIWGCASTLKATATASVTDVLISLCLLIVVFCHLPNHSATFSMDLTKANTNYFLYHDAVNKQQKLDGDEEEEANTRSTVFCCYIVTLGNYFSSITLFGHWYITYLSSNMKQAIILDSKLFLIQLERISNN